MAIERKGKVRYKQSLVKPEFKRRGKLVEEGLRSPETKKQYRWQINAFLRFMKLKEEA